jgi:hypothetical protein
MAISGTGVDNDRVFPEEFIPLETVRVRLGRLWLIGALAITTIMVVQSLLGRYEKDVQEAWGWLLPTIMPTLGMIVAVLSYTALDRTLLNTSVRRSIYQITWWLSLVYMFFILLTILVQPFTSRQPVELMRMSNMWLGPMQGLVGSALGVLFVSKKRR